MKVYEYNFKFYLFNGKKVKIKKLNKTEHFKICRIEIILRHKN